MSTSDFDELMGTVLQVLRETFPDLDVGFVEAVVRAEERYPESDAEAIRAIQSALREALAKQGAS